MLTSQLCYVSHRLASTITLICKDNILLRNSTATIKDTGDGYNLLDSRKKDRFLTTGIGYSSLTSKNNSQLQINAFVMQNEEDDMNSSLLSFTYNKKF